MLKTNETEMSVALARMSHELWLWEGDAD